MHPGNSPINLPWGDHPFFPPYVGKLLFTMSWGSVQEHSFNHPGKGPLSSVIIQLGQGEKVLAISLSLHRLGIWAYSRACLETRE